MNIHSPSMLTSDATATGEWRGLRKRLEVADPDERIAALEQIAAAVRRDVVTMIDRAQLGHIGGDLSVTDILVALFRRGARRRPGGTRATTTETASSSPRAIVPARCTPRSPQCGLLPRTELLFTFMAPLSALNGHPNRTKVPGVETNTGPLGHGFPVAVGCAVCRPRLRRPEATARSFVLRRRGAAGGLQLGGGDDCRPTMTSTDLTAIVDRNRLQQGARTEDTKQPRAAPRTKWESF